MIARQSRGHLRGQGPDLLRCHLAAPPRRTSITGSVRQKKQFVHVAPSPLLVGLGRPHERVGCLAVVGGRMMPGRLVTTPDLPALQALSQVDPLRAFDQTVDALERRCRRHINWPWQVCTGLFRRVACAISCNSPLRHGRLLIALLGETRVLRPHQVRGRISRVLALRLHPVWHSHREAVTYSGEPPNRIHASDDLERCSRGSSRSDHLGLDR